MVNVEQLSDADDYIDAVHDLVEERKALLAIIFGLYNGGQVPAEHVALYQEIGEGGVPK